jgi:hypothetical protein
MPFCGIAGKLRAQLVGVAAEHSIFIGSTGFRIVQLQENAWFFRKVFQRRRECSLARPVEIQLCRDGTQVVHPPFV